MIVYVRGAEFEEFAKWLGKQLTSAAFDSGSPLPMAAAKAIVEQLEPKIAKRALLEAANIVDTHAIDAEVKGVLAAAIKTRAEAF